MLHQSEVKMTLNDLREFAKHRVQFAERCKQLAKDRQAAVKREDWRQAARRDAAFYDGMAASFETILTILDRFDERNHEGALNNEPCEQDKSGAHDE